MSKLGSLTRVIVLVLPAVLVMVSTPDFASAQDGGQLYLVHGSSPDNIFPDTPEKSAVFLENIIVPSLEALANDPRVVAGGLPTAQKRAVMIIQADSPQEVADMLHALPFWHMLRWKVTPLESFQSRADKEKKVAEKLKTMK